MSDFQFLPFGTLTDEPLVEEIAQLTHRSPAELTYLLAPPAHSESRSFGIRDGAGKLVGFQAFMHRRFSRGDSSVQAFRSEFTIAEPTLRGTGIFPKFYNWTLERIRDEFGTTDTYMYGETTHKAWLNYGFRMIRRYSFHQVRPGARGTRGRFAKQADLLPLRVITAMSAVLRPLVIALRRREALSPPIVTSSLSLTDYNEALRLARPRRWRLSHHEDGLRYRFEANPFFTYEFWSIPTCLLVVRRLADDYCEIADILARTAGGYLVVLHHLLNRYDQVEFHGNLLSEARAPYFWLNLAHGFRPLVGGGSYVENNATALRVHLRDIPLYEAYHFGTPGQ